MSERPRLVVCLFAAFIGLAGLFGLPPLDRDEARFAQASAQMLESGDFVTIRFLDEERNKKPAGIHWLQSATVSTFSSAEARQIWAYRLPSFMAMVGAAFFIFQIGKTLFNQQTGLIASVIFASAPIAAAEATIAKTDAMLLLTICIAQWALAKSIAANQTSLGRALIFWLALAASILIKGPIGLLVCGSTLVVLCIADKTIKPLQMMRPLLGMLIVIAIVSPWAMAINAATDGRFFADALGGDLLGKVGSAQERHAGPPGYHLLLLPILFWPAAIFLPTALQTAFQERREMPWRFLLAWAAPAWLLFELTSTKLPHYTLPLYPSIAIAVAAILTGTLRGEKKAQQTRLNLVGVILYGLISLCLVIAIPWLSAYYNGSMSLALSAALITAAGTAYVVYLFLKKRILPAAFSAIACSSIFAWLMMQAVLPSLEDFRVSPSLVEAVKASLSLIHI